MQEIIVPVAYLQIQPLTQALIQALPNMIPPPGVTASNDGAGATGGSVRLTLADNAQPADITAAQSVAAAHDPVFLSADKSSIQANGADTATVTIRAPKQGAAGVTLTITVTSPGGNVTNQDDVIALIGGIGTETITALDPATITITVKNPANRSADSLSITAR